MGQWGWWVQETMGERGGMEGGLALCLHAQEPLMAIQDAFGIPAASVRNVLVRWCLLITLARNY